MKPTKVLVSALLKGVLGGIAEVTVRVYFPAVLVVLLVFVPSKAIALDVVYVMRHAQKDPDWTGDDEFKPLTEKGAQCAKKRAKELHKKNNIVAVYTKEMVRTLATGMAVSIEIPGIEVIGYDKARNDSIGDYLKGRHPSPTGKGTAILVVAQSADIEELILAFRQEAKNCLSAPHLKLPVGPDQYGDLWVINLDPQVPVCESILREDPLPLGAGDKNGCGTPG